MIMYFAWEHVVMCGLHFPLTEFASVGQCQQIWQDNDALHNSMSSVNFYLLYVVHTHKFNEDWHVQNVLSMG